LKTLAELDTHLGAIRTSPRDRGSIEMIIRRPQQGEREILDEAELDITRGMVGDRWLTSPSKRTPDGSPNPLQQLTLMNVRALAALADRDEWPRAGDQFLVDLDLSETHLPARSELSIGEAVIVITEVPHTGCAKFTERFGSDATKWVNSGEGLARRLRGVNARVVTSGVVRVGDSLRRR
jgi:MOSC domain-containing protein YiiM